MLWCKNVSSIIRISRIRGYDVSSVRSIRRIIRIRGCVVVLATLSRISRIRGCGVSNYKQYK